MVSPKYHVFVCAGTKLSGDKKGLCHSRGSEDLVRAFMTEIDERELSGEVLVSATSCFGICDKGPIAVVYPDGVWYGGLDAEKVAVIAEEHLEGGTPVKSLLI
ncbi:(2Fe-2S) ferredoxin domain-containing protein [Treponema endosymbiont of Eucomonympha sp.]|uniref:(2Fe-2S) ferredoxin domain-containing protein n=1 Tax=Treponema endosymbiont of Eucomonympha sp. TaxID=1580831 RepID=UPI000780411D|nr:(2Fe-2S) ferredoxin domain-containing protein [Treponema endosymbiont of Eucomonympha sp.]